MKKTPEPHPTDPSRASDDEIGGIYWVKIPCLEVVVTSRTHGVIGPVVIVQVGRAVRSARTAWDGVLDRFSGKRSDWGKVMMLHAPRAFPTRKEAATIEECQRKLDDFPDLGLVVLRDEAQRRGEVAEPFFRYITGASCSLEGVFNKFLGQKAIKTKGKAPKFLGIPGASEFVIISAHRWDRLCRLFRGGTLATAKELMDLLHEPPVFSRDVAIRVTCTKTVGSGKSKHIVSRTSDFRQLVNLYASDFPEGSLLRENALVLSLRLEDLLKAFHIKHGFIVVHDESELNETGLEPDRETITEPAKPNDNNADGNTDEDGGAT